MSRQLIVSKPQGKKVVKLTLDPEKEYSRGDIENLILEQEPNTSFDNVRFDERESRKSLENPDSIISRDTSVLFVSQQDTGLGV